MPDQSRESEKQILTLTKDVEHLQYVIDELEKVWVTVFLWSTNVELNYHIGWTTRRTLREVISENFMYFNFRLQ